MDYRNPLTIDLREIALKITTLNSEINLNLEWYRNHVESLDPIQLATLNALAYQIKEQAHDIQDLIKMIPHIDDEL